MHTIVAQLKAHKSLLSLAVFVAGIGYIEYFQYKNGLDAAIQKISHTVTVASVEGKTTVLNTQKNVAIQKPFFAGVYSSLALGVTMTIIEKTAQAYFNNNLFSTSLPHQALKVLFSVCTAMGVSQLCSTYKEINKTTNNKLNYLKGLLFGGLFLLPFCSDL
jgi:hypothetical protein